MDTEKIKEREAPMIAGIIIVSIIAMVRGSLGVEISFPYYEYFRTISLTLSGILWSHSLILSREDEEEPSFWLMFGSISALCGALVLRSIYEVATSGEGLESILRISIENPALSLIIFLGFSISTVLVSYSNLYTEDSQRQEIDYTIAMAGICLVLVLIFTYLGPLVVELVRIISGNPEPELLVLSGLIGGWFLKYTHNYIEDL